MKKALIKFEDSMDNMVYTAQINHPNCDLIPSTTGSNHPVPRRAE